MVFSLTSANANPLISGSGVTKVTTTGTTGVFTVPATSLVANSGHSFKAYATNAIGTTYTSVATFTTGPASTVVTTTANSGVGSLRQAELNANANPGADAITFDPTVFATAQTIVLATSNLAPFTGDTTVTGPAAGVTVQGVSVAGGVFTVGAGTTASFSKLTISRGPNSILNHGTLTASNCVFSVNGIAGINNVNTATVTGCSFLQTTPLYNGVAPVNAAATLTVSDCSFTDSLGTFITNNGTATMSGCTSDDTVSQSNHEHTIQNFAGATLTLTNRSLLSTDLSAGIFNNEGTLAF